MTRLLLRLGALLILIGAVCLVAGDTLFGGADPALVRTLFGAGGLAVAAAVVAWGAGRMSAGLAARSCRRCGRRVPRGRIYCDDHQREAINEYRDHQRDRRE